MADTATTRGESATTMPQANPRASTIAGETKKVAATTTLPADNTTTAVVPTSRTDGSRTEGADEKGRWALATQAADAKSAAIPRKSARNAHDSVSAENAAEPSAKNRQHDDCCCSDIADGRMKDGGGGRKREAGFNNSSGLGPGVNNCNQ